MESEESRWYNRSEEGIWQVRHNTYPIRRSGEESDVGSINTTKFSGERELRVEKRDENV